MTGSECDPDPFLRVVGSRSTRQCRDAAASAQHAPLILDNPLVQRKLKAPLTRDNAQATGGLYTPRNGERLQARQTASANNGSGVPYEEGDGAKAPIDSAGIWSCDALSHDRGVCRGG